MAWRWRPWAQALAFSQSGGATCQVRAKGGKWRGGLSFPFPTVERSGRSFFLAQLRKESFHFSDLPPYIDSILFQALPPFYSLFIWPPLLLCALHRIAFSFSGWSSQIQHRITAHAKPYGAEFGITWEEEKPHFGIGSASAG